MSEQLYRNHYTEGQQIGALIFLSRVPVQVKGETPRAKFRCSCGNEFVARIQQAQIGKTKSCGCLRPKIITQPRITYTHNEKIGELVFLNRINPKNPGDSPKANFLCTCGKEFSCRIESVRNLVTRSCGCKSAEFNTIASTKHGHAPDGNRSTEYNSWQAMWNRCTRPSQQNYERYKQLGITVCDEWKDFKVFINDMGLKPSIEHTIDRIDNTKGYYKENCRWATKKEQSRNMRNTTFVEYSGYRKSIPEWADVTGLTLATLYNRIVKNGWSAEKALTSPTQKGLFPKQINRNSHV